MSEPTLTALLHESPLGFHVSGPASNCTLCSDEATRLYRAGVRAPGDGLDAAWAEAEAALPVGWDLMVGHTSECRSCPGWWATASKRLAEPPHYPEVVSSEDGRARGDQHDAAPSAALRALVVRLAQRSVAPQSGR